MAGERGVDRLRDTWALPLRLMLGAAFIFHGLPKVGAGHGAFAATLQHMGVPIPAVTAWVVALVEFVGGICLLLGALVPIAAILLVIEMLVAMWMVHLPHGFEAVNIIGKGPQGPRFGMPGIEVNLLYIAGLLALFLGGAGPLSVDRAVRRRVEERRGWAVGRPQHA